MENGRKPGARRAPRRDQKNRGSYSLSDANFDLVYNEASRLNVPMVAAVNMLLDQLREYRSGERRFVERRKVPR